MLFALGVLLVSLLMLKAAWNADTSEFSSL